MKTKFWYFLLMGLIVVCSSQLGHSGQEVTWEIHQHSTDIDLIKDEISEFVSRGYVPLGITYDNVELYVLYVQDPNLEIEAWSIEWYENRDEVKDGLNQNLNQGYIPTGITYVGDLLYVLYVKIESSATAWRLEKASSNLNAVKNVIQPHINNGYIPVGITLLEGEYWTLLLKIPGTTVKSWMIERYKVGEHGDAINENIRQGYMPWGIMYRDDIIDILYVGF